jgi:hypothetical protein
MKIIELTKGYTTIVDDELYSALVVNKWFTLEYINQAYACRWKKPKTYPRICIRMHHEILNVDPIALRRNNLVVDHIDRNSLNNQKVNLRVTTRSVNAYNSNRSDTALGIYWDSLRCKFKCMVLQPKRKFVGWFDDIDEAIEAQARANGQDY